MKKLALDLLALGALLSVAALRADEGKPDPKQQGPDAGALFDRLDANQDGQLTSDEVPEEHQRLFGRLQKTADKDGNGQISRDEFAAGLKDSRPPRQEDQPGGGKPGEGPPLGGPDPQSLFNQLDANGDGKVTIDEVPEERRERFKRGVGKADRDGDGAVTREEFMAGMRALLGGGPKPPQPGGDKGKRPPGGDMRVLAALDQDKDGTLSADEIAAASKGLLSLDANGDGSLSREELLPAPPQPKQPGGSGQPKPGAKVSAEDMLRRFKEADTDGDGKLSLGEAPDPLKQHFDDVDKNQDGFIDDVELKQMVAGLGGLRPGGGPGDFFGQLKQADKDGDGKFSRDEAPDFLKPHFDAVDADQDGLVDQQELKLAMQKLTQNLGGQIAEHIKQADKDGDGKLSRDEAPEFLQRMFDKVDRLWRASLVDPDHPEFLQRMFDKVDRNKDGFVDEQEIRRISQRPKPDGKQPPKPEGDQPPPKPEPPPAPEKTPPEEGAE